MNPEQMQRARQAVDVARDSYKEAAKKYLESIEASPAELDKARSVLDHDIFDATLLTFCPESDVLWNVWTDGDPLLIGRVVTVDGERRFFFGETDVPSGGCTVDAEKTYMLDSDELLQIASFLTSREPWRNP